MLFVSLPKALGGSNRSLVTLLGSLEGKVHRILASPREGPFADFASERGIADEWVGLRRKGPLSRLRRVVDAFHIAWWAIGNRHRLHAIHGNATTGLITASLAGILTRKPLIVWVHDPVSTKWGRRLGPWLRRLIPDLRVAAVSTTAEGVAIEMGICRPGEAVLVPNPIHPDDVVFDQPIEHDGTTVAILGGTSHRKGFDQVPGVVAELSNVDVQWLLYLNPRVTPENEDAWARLSEFESETIAVPGRTTNVSEAYALADVVFCPSREESFCRVAAEAMMNGIPVVGSDIPPLRHLLGDGAGMLFPLEDASAAAAALRTIIEDPALRRRMGEVGKRRAAAFLPDDVADQMSRLYGITGG